MNNHLREYLCRGAVVEISSVNLKPKLGLFNGARGTVVDLLFVEGDYPNAGDLPEVVVVDFLQYKGPPWDPDYPTHVPIIPITRKCEYKCCERCQIPLTIAWAETIHTCQVMNIGFTKEVKLPNAAVRAIIDFGNRSMEARCPGLTYCGISRGTTIGKVGESLSIPPKSLDSAIYFRAGTFPENIQDLTISLNTMEEYKKVIARNNWVEYLKTRETNITYTEKEAEMIINWMKNTTIKVNDMIQ